MWDSTMKHEIKCSPVEQASPHAPSCLKALKRSVFSLGGKCLSLPMQVSEAVPWRSPIHCIHTCNALAWGLFIPLNFTLISHLI